LRHVGRRQPVLGAQQQQIVSGAKTRMLEHAQRPPAARVLQARLQREHLAHAERKAPGNRDANLRLAHRAVAGLEDRRQLMPARRWRRLDERSNRPI